MFARTLPQRMLAVEATALRNVAAGYRAYFHVHRASERSYVERSPLRDLVPILPLTVLPEIPIVHLFAHGSWAWIAWTHDVLAIYLTLFLTGLYATMAQREHELDGDTLVVHAGMIASAKVPRASIVRTRVLAERAARRLGRMRGVIRLPALKTDYVLLVLAEDVRVFDLLGTPRSTRRLLVPSDRPALFQERLRRSITTDGQGD